MKILVLAALAILIQSIGAVSAPVYNPPVHNYYQNNWTTGRG